MKKVLVTLLVVFLLSLAGVAFAFWAASVSVDPDPNNVFSITIGAPDDIQTELIIGGIDNPYGTLVPVGGAIGNTIAPSDGALIEYALVPITITWAGEALDENYESKFADFSIALTKSLSTNPNIDDEVDETGEPLNVSLGFLEALNLVEMHLYPLADYYFIESIVGVVEEEIDSQKEGASFTTAENILSAIKKVGLEPLGAMDVIKISYHDSINLLLVVWINKASPISIGYLVDCVITVAIKVTDTGFAILNPIDGDPVKKPINPPITPPPPITNPS